MEHYYLAPPNWDIRDYRGIYTAKQIANLPEDWHVSIDDCDDLGEHATYADAIRDAIDSGHIDDLSPEDINYYHYYR